MINTLNYILWQVQPEIIEGFRVRWYGLLFALGFVVGIQLFLRFFGKERNDGNDFNDKDTDRLIIYIVLGVVLGARFGHCLFYEPSYYLSNPLEILMIQKGGLASHGAGIGLLVGLFLFMKKEKRFSFLWLLDRLALAVAISGCFIRFGNLMNSEIIGKPYDGPGAFAFVEETKNVIESQEHILDVTIIKNNSWLTQNNFNYPGVKVEITFIPEMSEQDIQSFLDQSGNQIFTPPNKFYKRHILDPTVNFTVSGSIASVNTFLITRHPAQLYESISSLILFIILSLIYLKLRKNTPEGLLSGMFFIWIFTLRFFYEFLKENQVLMEEDMSLNIGQKLSIPMVLLGIFLIYKSLKNKSESE